MKIVFLGSGQFGIDSLNALRDCDHELAFIVTQPAQKAGRGRKTKPTPVANWARENGVDFVEAPSVNAPEIMADIDSYKPDLIVVIAFGQKISDELIAYPPKGMINVHGSLLPKYRGAAPINWAIVNGETETGITIATVSPKIDAGKILARACTSIIPGETAGQLSVRLAKLSPPVLLETIDKIGKGTAVYTDQDESLVTMAPKMKKSYGFLDFTEPANSLLCKILGFSPWPGASADYISKETGKCTRVIIADAEVVTAPNPKNIGPGLLDDDLNVICGKDALRINQIKPAGKDLMDFKAFVNGYRVTAGDLFMKIEA